MDVGIYEAMDELDDSDRQMRYLYDNVPHHQDQITSPHKLRNEMPWGEILSLLNNSLGIVWRGCCQSSKAPLKGKSQMKNFLGKGVKDGQQTNLAAHLHCHMF